jgi:hypothetical protein
MRLLHVFDVGRRWWSKIPVILIVLQVPPKFLKYISDYAASILKRRHTFILFASIGSILQPVFFPFPCITDRFSHAVYSSTLKKGAIYSSETFVNIHHNKQLHIPENTIYMVAGSHPTQLHSYSEKGRNT